MEEDLTSNVVLYKYGPYVSSIAGSLKQIDRGLITSAYENLPIHSRKDVDITANQIVGLLNIDPSHLITNIFDDLINQILCGKLDNNYQAISKYIIDNYK